jgi:lipid II:glycine glycyltransferase (peptidoglycan interpeptide bridge formation enzyme)
MEGASAASVAFHSHSIELKANEDALWGRLNSAVRRGIRKAKNAGVRIEFSGTADAMDAMEAFFPLHCQTRKRQGLPPQPHRFFRNMTRHLLGGEHGFIARARVGGRTVAAAVYFHFGSNAIYKFGASDYGAQHLRANNLVMWEALKRCASMGLAQLHLGRTSLANAGLRRFKVGFGAREGRIEYRRYDFRQEAFVTSKDRAVGWLNNVLRYLPGAALRLAGSAAYPHLS